MGHHRSRGLLRWLSLALAFVFIAMGKAQSSLQDTPDLDPFYRVPDNIDSFENGAIIRSRRPPTPLAAFQAVPLPVSQSFQFLYKTNDNFNKSTATVLTVAVPKNADFTKVLSFQFAEDAAYIRCAPSFAVRLGGAGPGRFVGSIVTQLELALLAGALKKGWVVIMPDHQGPNSAFLANRQAGHAVLDGIRAAKRSRHMTGIARNPRVALWGYSGGSLATGWAAELNPSYAPDVEILGAAMGGTVPVAQNTLQLDDKTIFAGLVASGVQGVANQYPEIRQLVIDQIRPEFRAKFDRARRQCLVDNILTFAFNDIQGMFKDRNIFKKDPALDSRGKRPGQVDSENADIYL